MGIRHTMARLPRLCGILAMLCLVFGPLGACTGGPHPIPPEAFPSDDGFSGATSSPPGGDEVVDRGGNAGGSGGAVPTVSTGGTGGAGSSDAGIPLLDGGDDDAGSLGDDD